MDYVKYIRSKVGHDKIILNAAGVIIVKDNKILLQHRSDNHKWGLIGGIMELDETYEETALREAKEETSLDVKLDYLLGIYHNHNMEWPSKDKAHVIAAYYVASIINGEVTTDHESLELKWFSIDELPELFADDHKQALNDYINKVRKN